MGARQYSSFFKLHLVTFAFSSLQQPSLERLQKGSLAGFLRESAGLAEGC
jgi:hypothetical protein